MARLTDDRTEIPPLSDEEQERMLELLEQLRRRREELYAARGGKLFPPAGREVNRICRQRERELG